MMKTREKMQRGEQVTIEDAGVVVAKAPPHTGFDATVEQHEEDLPAWQRSQKARRGAGLKIERRMTRTGANPFENLLWERRNASITNEKGEVIFEQKGVEFPQPWSQMATSVVVSKYFRGMLGSPEREFSVRQLAGRVVGTIAAWGREGRYFATEADAEAFEAELAHLLLHQMMSFNSPVWFNVGVERKPQCSACFINSVEDRMESILGLAKTEGMLFKFGSGTGTNLSPLRSSKEPLAGGGSASGPVSFMKGFDAFAGVIKSGGKTRRAAKMVILNVDHPDIVEFVNCKANEEKKAWALIDAGYDPSFNGEAYSSIFFQNSNNSVRVTDDFMRAVEADGLWQTRGVRDGTMVETIHARDLMRQIAEATWLCGDPGLQFDSTVNYWHTCPNTARINASNPCSEYMFLDDSACNLASLNLMKFIRDDGEFDVESFKHAVDITITAQEILVDFSSYPTAKIERNSWDYRPLGLGYANLGALLMARGLPYDSDEGRHYAAAITALMHGEAYLQSSRVAAQIGAFAGYDHNAEAFLQVIRKHRGAISRIDPSKVPLDLLGSVRKVWDETLVHGEDAGFRNAQVTVLAPTGTIAFMMDCDTTGIEPDIALVKYKKLVGGGMLKIVNNTVPMALSRLGYAPAEVTAISEYIDENDTIEGAPALKDEHLPVFDCAFKARNGTRTIHYMGHLRMMSAVQPFLSGAISKTVNLPNEASVEEIEQCYMESWKFGLKAVAVYRDGCKRSQPLNTSIKEDKDEQDEPVVETKVVYRPVRRKLPDERHAITHKFNIAGHEGYLTVGLYEDATPGEIFIVMAKQGSTISGLMDSFATSVSLAFQYGVPLQVLCDKFIHSRFEPSGFTRNPNIPIAKSLMDYIFRWLALKFLTGSTENEHGETQADAGVIAVPQPPLQAAAEPDNLQSFTPQQGTPSLRLVPASSHHTGGVPSPTSTQKVAFVAQSDSPPCHDCGSIMVRNGACYKCLNCGSTSGCS